MLQPYQSGLKYFRKQLEMDILYRDIPMDKDNIRIIRKYLPYYQSNHGLDSILRCVAQVAARLGHEKPVSSHETDRVLLCYHIVSNVPKQYYTQFTDNPIDDILLGAALFFREYGIKRCKTAQKSIRPGATARQNPQPISDKHRVSNQVRTLALDDQSQKLTPERMFVSDASTSASDGNTSGAHVGGGTQSQLSLPIPLTVNGASLSDRAKKRKFPADDTATDDVTGSRKLLLKKQRTGSEQGSKESKSDGMANVKATQKLNPKQESRSKKDTAADGTQITQYIDEINIDELKRGKTALEDLEEQDSRVTTTTVGANEELSPKNSAKSSKAKDKVKLEKGKKENSGASAQDSMTSTVSPAVESNLIPALPMQDPKQKQKKSEKNSDRESEKKSENKNEKKSKKSKKVSKKKASQKKAEKETVKSSEKGSVKKAPGSPSIEIEKTKAPNSTMSRSSREPSASGTLKTFQASNQPNSINRTRENSDKAPCSDCSSDHRDTPSLTVTRPEPTIAPGAQVKQAKVYAADVNIALFQQEVNHTKFLEDLLDAVGVNGIARKQIKMRVLEKSDSMQNASRAVRKTNVRA